MEVSARLATLGVRFAQLLISAQSVKTKPISQ